MHQYGYTLSEKRIWIMFLIIGYCILQIVKIFASGNIHLYLDSCIDFVHFQMTTLTLYYFFIKIMKILPEIRKRWTRNLWLYYWWNSTVLLLLLIGECVVVAVNYESFQMHQRCRMKSVRIFLCYQFATYLVYIFLNWRLRQWLHKIPVEMKLDRQIAMQYGKV